MPPLSYILPLVLLILFGLFKAGMMSNVYKVGMAGGVLVPLVYNAMALTSTGPFSDEDDPPMQPWLVWVIGVVVFFVCLVLSVMDVGCDPARGC